MTSGELGRRGSAGWFVVWALVGCGGEFTGTDHADAAGVDGSAGTKGGSSGSGDATSQGGAAGSRGAAGSGGLAEAGVAGSGAAGAAGATGGHGGAADGGMGRVDAAGTATGGRAGSSGGGGTSGGSGGKAGAAGSSVDAGPDASCSDMTSVNSCGPSCVKCPVTSDRAVPTCNGTSCGFACKNGDPKCSDGTCSRLSWTFDSGSLDGIMVRSSSGSPLAVRSFNGNNALAADVAQLNTLPEISFTVPVCLSGSVDLSAKTFTFRAYFDGMPLSMYDYWLQSAVPVPQSNAYLDQMGTGSGFWTSYSSPMNKSSYSGSTTTVTVQMGSLGAPFTGTIWIDDIAVK